MESAVALQVFRVFDAVRAADAEIKAGPPALFEGEMPDNPANQMSQCRSYGSGSEKTLRAAAIRVAANYCAGISYRATLGQGLFRVVAYTWESSPYYRLC